MKPRISGLIGIVALLAGTALACHNDPTAEGVGAPSQVLLSLLSVTLGPGESTTVTATVVDSRLTPLVGDITFSTCDGAVATVTPDPTFVPVPPTAKRAKIKAVAAPATCIVATSGSAKPDTVSVGVIPTSFPGALSATSAAGGGTLTISATPTLKFTSSSAVTFGGGHAGPIVSQTPDALQVLVPFSDAGTLTISGINVTYVPGLTVSLSTTASFTQTGDAWAASNDWQTAPDITSLLPGAGGTAVFHSTTTGVDNSAVCPEAVLGFGSSGPCMMFKFTLAAPDTVRFTTDWEGGAGTPDVDVYVCADSTVANFGTACFEDGGGGATGAKPQATGPGNALGAGTHWLVIEIFGGGTTRNITTRIQQ